MSRETFLKDVLEGLSKPQKEIPSKYFYDARGSVLFEQICQLPEYYLTRTEIAIMEIHAKEMAALLGPDLLLIEYGSGSSIKTRLLLDHLKSPIGYAPIDVSQSALEHAANSLAQTHPEIETLLVRGDFTARIELPAFSRQALRKAVYFPGSTIGNFGPGAAQKIFEGIRTLCGPGGGLLIGLDLKKDPFILEAAYNDRAGVTRDFNLNLLLRMNHELGLNFNINAFSHRAIYNSEEGRVEMHLVSRLSQKMVVDGAQVSFEQGESIRTECSYKYDLEAFCGQVETAGFQARTAWMDPKKLFAVQYVTIL